MNSELECVKEEDCAKDCTADLDNGETFAVKVNMYLKKQTYHLRNIREDAQENNDFLYVPQCYLVSNFCNDIYIIFLNNIK